MLKGERQVHEELGEGYSQKKKKEKYKGSKADTR